MRVDVQHYSTGHGVLQTSAIHCRKCAAWSQYINRERKGYQVFQIIFNFYVLLKFDNLYYFFTPLYIILFHFSKLFYSSLEIVRVILFNVNQFKGVNLFS